jgi:hypothetical protein
MTRQIKRYFGIMLLFVLMLVSGCDAFSPATPIPEGETIAEIQGAGHHSPLKGRPVYNVHGVVTAIRADGFYMQSIHPDDDPATSEGIFVFVGLVPGVKPGDEVLVNAMVAEFYPGGESTGNLSITQLENPHVEVLSNDNELPAPTVIGEGGRIPPTSVIEDDANGSVVETGVFDPDQDGLDFYESLEGMLVQVNDALAVGATTKYKEIAVVADGGANAGVMTPRGGLVIQLDDFNPERIILDDSMRQLPFVQTGDTSPEPIIGVMDYTFGNFKLQPTVGVNFESAGLSPEAPMTEQSPGQLRVASYNVENLSARDMDRIAILADHIVNWMASPDIIGLQEVMDNDGSVSTQAISADETYQAIANAIQAVGGPEYGFVDIDPVRDRDGGIPGGNIRVGFLYRLDTGLSLAEAPEGDAVTPVALVETASGVALSLNPGRIDPMNLAFADSRKPLVVAFMLEGEPLFIVNNHFNSKGGDWPLFGENQPPLFESEVQRLLQAQVVHDFVAQLLSSDPDARVIVLGDLNDFQFSPPIDLLEGEILINLVETLPLEEQYTYVYDGNSQVLDHILVSEALFEDLAEVNILHINSEFDYKLRFSDHEPVMATFDLD